MDENRMPVAVIAVIGALLMDEDERLFEGARQQIRPVHVDMDAFRHLEDMTFREHFRMGRLVFERLVVAVGNHLDRQGRLKRLRTPVDMCVMMSIWILATHDSFRSVAVKFAVPSKGTVHYHYAIFIEAVREMAPQFVQWPNEFERDNIKGHFERKCGYPGVIGCIDGTHIYISAPLVQPQKYVNRFRKHSVLCQAVSDHTLLFRDIYIGEPGSVHDARMYQRSPLSHNLLHNLGMVSDDEHLLGDGAYTLTDKLMTPYRDNGNLSRKQRHHNYVHASARSTVEKAFGLCKVKWRRLKLMLIFCHEYLIDTITASFVLHNFILLQGEPYLEMQEPLIAAPHVLPDVNVEDEPVIPEFDPALRAAKLAGRHKREFIATILSPNDE